MVLPELEALRGVEQSRFHHRDVYGHTLEVLDRTIALTSDRTAPEARSEWDSVLGVKRGRVRRCWPSRSPTG